MQIMRLIAAGQIDGKAAGLLLYALQTASANLPRTNFAPYLYEMVLDPKTVSQTPIGAHIWENSDFASDENEEEDEETMRIQVMEEAQRRARKKEALDKWAEAEADRLADVGRRQREAQRQADLREAQLEADRKRAADQRAEKIALEDARRSPAVTPPGRAIVPPPTAPLPGKRPSANVSMDDVRKKVTAQITKALPAIAAAQSNREKSTTQNGGRSG